MDNDDLILPEDQNKDEPEYHWTSQTERASLELVHFVKYGVYGLILILLIGLGFIGYGFYNGWTIKSYAQKAEAMLKKTDEAPEWKNFDEDWVGITFNSGDTEGNMKKIDKIRSDLSTVASDSDKALTDLSRTKAPMKAKELESKLKELFSATEKSASDEKVALDWFLELKKATDELYRLATLNVKSYDEFMKQLEDIKENFDLIQKRLSAMEVPQALQEQHTSLKTFLTDISKILDQVMSAARSSNIKAVQSTENELINAVNKLASTESPDKALERLKLVRSGYRNKINFAKEKAKAEINILKEKSFSF